MDNKTSWHQVPLGARCAAPHWSERRYGMAWRKACLSCVFLCPPGYGYSGSVPN